MSDRDTKGAQGDLFMAISYLKDRDAARDNDYPLRAMLLEKATQYVVSAREKDPDVTVDQKLTDMPMTIPRTADDLSAKILYEQFRIERLFASTAKKAPRCST